MEIAKRVRSIYERRPYPPPRLRGVKTTLPPLAWIDAMRVQPLAPRRILVAGCGVGSEAFMLATMFPSAQIVAVDFSDTSIALARRLRKEYVGDDRVRFEVADISSPSLDRVTGDSFDLVTCHGVLSYVPDIAATLSNFSRLLRRSGTLYLGVNGTSHVSRRYRRVLEEFGFDPNEFRESAGMRNALRVCDSMQAYPPVPVAEKDQVYLASDVFGPLNHALPLDTWSSLLAKVRLYVRASYHAFFLTRQILDRQLHEVVMPRSRAEVASLVDMVFPASFHHLVISREKPPVIPWTDSRRLMKWRPVMTNLYEAQWPDRARGPLREVRLRSKPVGTKVTLSIPPWEVQALRRADGERTLGELVPRGVAGKDVASAMYLLYLTGALNLLPPR